MKLILGKRKTQKMGGSIVVTLPKIWTTNKKADDLEFVDFYLDANQDLIIRSHDKTDDSKPKS